MPNQNEDEKAQHSATTAEEDETENAPFVCRIKKDSSGSIEIHLHWFLNWNFPILKLMLALDTHITYNDISNKNNRNIEALDMLCNIPKKGSSPFWLSTNWCSPHELWFCNKWSKRIPFSVCHLFIVHSCIRIFQTFNIQLHYCYLSFSRYSSAF